MCLSSERALLFCRSLKGFYHRQGLGHILLLFSYILFLSTGALLFFVVESRSSGQLRSLWLQSVAERRHRFVQSQLLPDIFNNSRLLLFIHGDKSHYLMGILKAQLRHYEGQLLVRPPMPRLPWTLPNALLFTCSTATTIGYGYIYPATRTGRLLSIAYSLMGIPFTIVVIKDMAYLLAKLLNYPCVLLGYVWHLFRYCTLQPVQEDELMGKLAEKTPHADFRLASIDRLLDIPVTVAVMALAGWIGSGIALMAWLFPHLSTETAFYFVFNSLATIGVSDIDPGDSHALLFLFAYIFIGLALVSLFINLVHTKFSRQYWMPDRLLLRGPNGRLHRIASFEDDDDDLAMDSPKLNHYVTLGVLQAEDRRPLLGVIAREKALQDAQTQTGTPGGRLMLARGTSAEALILTDNQRSRDDVNTLIVETYGGRPPRMIPPVI